MLVASFCFISMMAVISCYNKSKTVQLKSFPRPHDFILLHPLTAPFWSLLQIQILKKIEIKKVKASN